MAPELGQQLQTLLFAAALAVTIGHAAALGHALGVRSRKDPSMSEAPEAPEAAAGEAVSNADAPIAAGVTPTPPPAAQTLAAVSPTAVVTSVVQSVNAHPAVAPAAAPSVIASILAGLAQVEPAIFAVTRSSAQTQTTVGLALGLAEVILAAFLRPAA